MREPAGFERITPPKKDSGTYTRLVSTSGTTQWTEKAETEKAQREKKKKKRKKKKKASSSPPSWTTPTSTNRTFDGQCGIPGMEASLPNCNIPCSYGGLEPFRSDGSDVPLQWGSILPRRVQPWAPYRNQLRSGTPPKRPTRNMHPSSPPVSCLRPPVFVSLSLSVCLSVSVSRSLYVSPMSLFPSFLESILTSFFFSSTFRQV